MFFCYAKRVMGHEHIWCNAFHFVVRLEFCILAGFLIWFSLRPVGLDSPGLSALGFDFDFDFDFDLICFFFFSIFYYLWNQILCLFLQLFLVYAPSSRVIKIFEACSKPPALSLTGTASSIIVNHGWLE